MLMIKNLYPNENKSFVSRISMLLKDGATRFIDPLNRMIEAMIVTTIGIAANEKHK